VKPPTYIYISGVPTELSLQKSLLKVPAEVYGLGVNEPEGHG
jgi:hypothetical protein